MEIHRADTEKHGFLKLLSSDSSMCVCVPIDFFFFLQIYKKAPAIFCHHPLKAEQGPGDAQMIQVYHLLLSLLSIILD